MPTHTIDPDRSQPEPVATEKSPLSLSVISATVAMAVVVISATWYLGTLLSDIKSEVKALTVKIDNQANKADALSGRMNDLEKELSEHKLADERNWGRTDAKFDMMSKTGSQKAIDVEKEVNALRVEWEIYKASHGKP